jgi:cobyrinic acid a,c-diamide synthase
MGLFDGKGGGDLASTAHVARLLEAPVVLVVDARAMSRSVAAIVHGYNAFDPDLRVAGVILNRVGSRAHETMLREALKPLSIPVLGVLRRNDEIDTPDRHLGLVPVAERRSEATRSLHALGKVISLSLNLDGIVRLARSAGPLVVEAWSPESRDLDRSEVVRVAVATGPSFSFLYRENLELLECAGAEVVTFDPTTEEDLPTGTDALYLGGGFPETYAESLSTNWRMRERVRTFAAAGRPVVAECGGLLYLVRELDGHPMCGVLDARATMTDRLTLGYREAHALMDSVLAERGANVRGHEFHYSDVEPGAGERPAWELIDRGQEGFVSSGVHASYLHTHWAATPELPRRLVLEASRSAAGVGV